MVAMVPVLAGAMVVAAAAGQLLVGYSPGSAGYDDFVGLYSTSGVALNPGFISGLSTPHGLVVDGDDLFVMNSSSGWIGRYSLSGATANPRWYSTGGGYAMTGDGNGHLFVLYPGSGSIGEITTTGETVNGSLITGLDIPLGVAAIGGYIYAANYGSGSVGKYTLSGTPVNTALISGLETPMTVTADGDGNVYVGYSWGMWGLNKVGKYDSSGAVLNADLVVVPPAVTGLAVDGGELYVTYADGTVGAYSTSGDVLGAPLISGLGYACAIAVVPEPSTAVLLLVGITLRVLWWARTRRECW